MECMMVRIFLVIVGLASALSPPTSRRAALLSTASTAMVVLPVGATSDEEIARIVTEDVTKRQFLATADFTRSLYDDNALFQDEIDTYTLDKFIVGTKKLFDASKSKVELTSPVLVDKAKATFSFRESLCFNLPVVKPVVRLSGRVELSRDPKTGLFTKYREFWDQTPTNVVLSAFSSNN